STPFAQAGIARRTGAHFAFDATVLTTDRVALAEVGAYYISSQALVRAAVLGSSDGGYGGLLQISSQGNSRLNFGLGLPDVHVGRQSALLTSAPAPPVPPVPGASVASNAPALPIAGNSFSQIAANISYSLPRVQLSVAASLRHDAGQPTHYSIGPSLRWD